MRPNIPVVLMENKILGYNFRYAGSDEKQSSFMAALKSSVPLKMWDPGSLRWWVPDIYSVIVESIAIEHGTLSQADLEKIRGYRAKYIDVAGNTLDSDFILLGVVPGSPLRIAEMAAAYWKTNLNSIPCAVLEVQAKCEAWDRISAHFKAEAAKPVPQALGPLGTAR